MIFSPSDEQLDKDTSTFFNIISGRAERFENAPADCPEGPSGVNLKQLRMHPERTETVIESVTVKAPGILEVTLADPGIAVHRPGQFVRVYDSEGVSHPVFITSAPGEQYSLCVSSAVTPSLFRWLESARPGETISISGPSGHFYHNKARDSEDIVFFCDSAGIPAALAFAGAYERIRVFAVSCPRITPVDERFVYVNGADGIEPGFIGKSVFACGTRSFLEALNGIFENERIRMFICEDYSSGQTGEKYRCTVIRNDSETSIDCFAGETLLAAFERAGLRVRAECLEGECGFCRCALVSGSVRADYGFHTDLRCGADAKRNIIHPCRTFPESDITVKF